MDEQLNVTINTNAGASGEELAAYDALLKKLAADYKTAESGATAFAGAQQSQANQAAQNAATYNQGVNQTADNLNGLKTVVSDVETHVNGLRRTSAALRGLGLEAFGDFVGKIAQIQQVAREFNSLVDIVPKLVKGIPFVEEGFQSLTNSLGKDAANFVGLAGTLGVVGLAVTALTAVYNAQKQAAEEARKAAIAGLDAQSQYIANINTGSKDIVQKARDDLAHQKKDAEDQITLLQNIPDALKKIIDLEGGEGINNETVNKAFQPIKDQLVQMGAISAETAKNIDAKSLFDVINDKIKALQNSSTQAAVGVTTYDTALKSGKLTADEAKAAIKDQADATKEATKANEEYGRALVKNVVSLYEAQQALKTENEKYASTLAERVQADARAGAQSALEAQVSKDKEIEAQQEGADKLVAIRKSETDLETSEAQKRAESVAKINSQFLEQSGKLWSSYYTTEIRDEADYATQRRRKLEDLNSQLLSYVGTRDVAAFLSIQQKGMTDLSRGDSDETTSETRRREDYQKQAAEAEAAREQQLQQLQASLDAETATKRQSLQKQEADQIASNNATIKQSAVDEAKLAALQKMWSANDLAAKRAIEDNAHAQTVARLTLQQQQLSAVVSSAISPVVSFFGQVTTAIVSMFQQVHAAATASYSGGQHTPTGGYASGVNFVPRDMLTVVHYGEKITRAVDNHPQRQQDNRPIQVSIGTWGQVVSQAEMHEQVGELVSAIRIATGKPA